jgi:hypothetical protein
MPSKSNSTGSREVILPLVGMKNPDFYDPGVVFLAVILKIKGVRSL